MFTKILVALDHSHIGDRVFAEALTLANATHAQLMLLHVLSPFEDHYPNMPLMSSLDSYYPPLYEIASDEYRKRWDEFENWGLDLLKNRAAAAISAGVSMEFTQNIGDPGRVICAIARNWDADLVIMGRRGRSGLSELVMGSTSNYVLHHAPCSVLIVQGLVAEQNPAETNQVPTTA